MQDQQLNFLSALEQSLRRLEIVYQGGLGDTLIAEVCSADSDYIVPIPASQSATEQQIRTFCTQYIQEHGALS